MYTGTGSNRSTGIAAIACCAVMTDTSCSTERLPKNTPTFTCSATLPTRCRTAENDDLLLELDPELLVHGVPRHVHQVQDVGRRRVVDVDDEIRVFGRDLRTPGSEALEARCLDKPARLVVGRILEDAAEAANPVRLRRLAFRLDRVRAFANLLGVVGVNADARADDHVGAEVVLESRVAIAEAALVSR